MIQAYSLYDRPKYPETAFDAVSRPSDEEVTSRQWTLR